jgi:hypothetical protein
MAQVTHDNLADVISYHTVTENQLLDMQSIRDGAERLIRRILDHVPESADRTVAIRHVRDALMVANGAIALNGLI